MLSLHFFYGTLFKQNMGFFKIRPNLEIIGTLPIVSTDKIYLFATNYTDNSASGLARFSSDTGLSLVRLTQAIAQY